jgi:hypothetical protein
MRKERERQRERCDTGNEREMKKIQSVKTKICLAEREREHTDEFDEADIGRGTLYL